MKKGQNKPDLINWLDSLFSLVHYLVCGKLLFSNEPNEPLRLELALNEAILDKLFKPRSQLLLQDHKTTNTFS